MSLLLALILTTVVNQQTPVQHRVPIEVVQVIGLPLTITETALVKTKDGYLLKCLISNNSEFRTLGLRYSLAVVDAMNAVVTRNEGIKLRQSQTKSVTFKTPVKLKMKTDARLVLILEQVVSTEYVWEVVKAKDNLAAYIRGDYSVVARVLRLNNQVDTPPRRTVIY
jgi:hypothetical protein